jgi:antitoxin (DNA-binding transcriptional repressor) of toxin-antitoxin stability system
MNRIYKVIFNHALQIFQVVSELANGHSRAETPNVLKSEASVCWRGRKSSRAVMAALAVLSLSSVHPVLADNTVAAGNNMTVNEENGTVIVGTVNDPVFDQITAGGSSNTILISDAGIQVNDKIYITGEGLNANGQKISGVAAGTADTDAVNLKQLNAVSGDISTVQSQVNAGWTASVNGSTVKTVTPSDHTLNFTNGSNITLANNNGSIQISTSQTPSFTSVTAGTGASQVILGNSGVQVGGKIYISNAGINSNGKTITGVAAGVNDTDAVNKLQMNTAIDESMKYFKANSTGTDASASGADAVAVGSGASSTGGQAAAVGLNADASGDDALALGNTARASKEGAVAIGKNSGAKGKRSTAAGDSAQAVGDQALAVGSDASAGGTNSTALGNAANAVGDSAAAVGSQASASGDSAAAFGNSASAVGANSVAVGVSSQASGTNDISLGASAGVGTQSGSTSKIQQNRISIGTDSGQNGTGNENTAIGLNAGNDVSGNFNVAMGSSAGGSVGGDANIAIGYEANKNGSGSHSTAIGASTTASSGATALGYTASAEADNSVAVGYAAQANGSSGVAIGDSAVSADNSVALGHNSSASQADSSGISYLTSQPAGTNGVISVGSSEGNTTFQRRIINVADGSNGTDAVNVNQLKAAQTSVATLIGGGVTLNTDGSYSQFSLTDTNGTIHHYDTLAEALGQVTSNQIEVATADAVTYTDSTKTNINAGGTISQVADAVTSDQAVNLGQMNSAIADSQIKYYSVNSSESGNRDNTGATGQDAIAAGPTATAVGDRSISIGDNTKAQGTNSIAIGNSNTSDDRQATAYGQSSIAIGSSASSAGTNSIALGNYALTEVQNSTSTTVNSAVAIGDEAQATADQAVALGKKAHASGVNAFAQGNTSSATAESSIAMGTDSNAGGTASTVIGMNSTVNGTHSGLIGTAMSTDNNQAGTTLNGSDTYVVGNGNGTVGGTNSSIIGNSNTVGTTVKDPDGIDHSYNTVNTSILGNNNAVTAQGVDVIGHGNTVGKNNLNAAGVADGTIDMAAGSGVLGANNTVYGSGNKVIGNNNKDADLDSVFILGNNVTAGLGNSAYIGSGSSYTVKGDTTAGADSYGSVTVGNGTYTFAGASASGVVTVGSVGSERRIQNVSAGLVTAGSTDAVNGSQLYTLTRPLRFAGDNSTVGSYANASSTDQNVIQRSSDQAVKVTGGADLNNLSSNNIGVVADAGSNTLTVQLSKDLTGLHSVTAGNTVMNTNGVTITTGGNTVSLTNNGLNNGGKKITNVAAGSADMDAVNVSQLNTAAAKAAATVSDGVNTTVTSSTAADGHTDYQVNLNDTVTLGSGVNAVTVDGTKGTVTAGTGDNAVTVNGTNGTIQAGTKVSLDGAAGSGTVGNVTINGSGTTGTVNGLTNKTWDPENYVSGQAATEDQLKLATSGVANAGLDFAGNDGTVIHKNLGEQLNIVGGYEGTGTTSSTNIKTVRNQDGDLEIQMADDAVFNSLTTGNTVMNTNGITVGSGSSAVSLTSTGLNNGGNKITNVAAGSADMDAVNVSQLNTAAAKAAATVSDGVNTTVTSSTAADGHTDYQVNLNKDIAVDSVTAGNTKIDGDGLTAKDAAGNSTSVTGNGMTVTGANGKTVSVTSDGLDNGGNTITNVAAGVNGTDAVNVDQLNDTVEKAAAAAKTTVSAGKNMTVTPDTTAADGHTDYKVALNDTVTLGEGANAVTINGTNGTVTAGTKVSLDGVNGTGTVGNVTINGNGSTGTVNGLTNKTWDPKSYTSGQAATEDQLKELDDRSVQYDRNEDGSVNKGQITLGGDSGTKITNVAAGDLSSTSTDAVNGSQLYATNQAVENNTNNINILGDSVNRLGDRVNKVGAGAAALAALHPLDFDPDDKWDAAAGFGNYRNANAGAVGIFYRPNEDTMVSVGGSFGNGENMINAGVSFKLGQGNHVSTSRVAMAKELKDMRAVVAQQAEQIAKLTELVNALAGVKSTGETGTGMFPDVPENHWAYEAVKSLGEKGLIEGYPDGNFGGDRSLSRYEFAEIVYRALQKGMEVDGRLVSEFKPELERIRVDTVSRDRNGRPVIERVRVVR